MNHNGNLTRILIVDDEQPQMEALCTTLRDHGFETIGFSSPEQALAALENPGHGFELLLSDLMMPDMDGITLLRRALAVNPDLVGVIMTGQGTINSAVEAMKTGALDYILKPFKLSAAIPVLRRALEVRRLRMENAELARRVREHTEELEAMNKELEAFSYSVSHDLRAPLRAINGFSRILIERPGEKFTPEGKNLLEKVINGAKQMEKLIDDLLNFSRTGRQPLVRQPVQLSALVQQILDEQAEDRAGRNIDLKIDALPEINCDPGLIKQVFANLIGNATKFTRNKEQAVIEIGTRNLQRETVYFVRDNGAGFDMEYAQNLFGVFQRLHKASEFEGTGVGLSIVQRIIHRHGGRIWAEGEAGKGAAFYFTLPQGK